MNPSYQPTLKTHPINPPSQPTLTTRSHNPLPWPTPMTHPINPRSQPAVKDEAAMMEDRIEELQLALTRLRVEREGVQAQLTAVEKGSGSSR